MAQAPTGGTAVGSKDQAALKLRNQTAAQQRGAGTIDPALMSDAMTGALADAKSQGTWAWTPEALQALQAEASARARGLKMSAADAATAASSEPIAQKAAAAPSPFNSPTFMGQPFNPNPVQTSNPNAPFAGSPPKTTASVSRLNMLRTRLGIPLMQG